MKFIYDKFNLYEINTENQNMEIPLDAIYKTLSYNDVNQVKKFLNNLVSKRLDYSVLRNKHLLEGSICIFSSYNIYNTSLYLSFSSDFIQAQQANNVLFWLKINLFLFMEYEFSYNLYKFLILGNNNKNLKITMPYLKEILSVDNLYNRFYDFETKVLKNAVNDINTFSPFTLKYKKIKIGDYKNNRVHEIEFKLINKQVSFDTNYKFEIEQLLNYVKYDTQQLTFTYDLIFKYLHKHGFEYTKSNIDYTKQMHKKDFDRNLKRALLFDLAKYNKKIEFKKLLDIKKYYSAPFYMQTEISKQLNDLKLYDLYQSLLDSFFFNKIISLKDGEILVKEIDNYQLHVKYNHKQESEIQIYQIKVATKPI